MKGIFVLSFMGRTGCHPFLFIWKNQIKLCYLPINESRRNHQKSRKSKKTKIFGKIFFLKFYFLLLYIEEKARSPKKQTKSYPLVINRIKQKGACFFIFFLLLFKQPGRQPRQ